MARKKAKAKQKISKISSTLARQDDGTVQLTITIPYVHVQKAREEALRHLIEGIEIPGFRKGKAPQDVALKHIEQQQLLNHTLQHLLPQSWAQAAEEHKLEPVLAPRFELISINEGEDWSVRAITCELPKVKLGDYKKKILGMARAGDIWTPAKGDPKKQGSGKNLTREEKEQKIIQALLEIADTDVPRLLVEEEVNHKLSRLLEQVQRLGITIERYVASTGKTIEQIKEEYAQQAQNSIKLELVLNKLAEEEKVEIEDKEIEEIIKASGNEQAEEALSSPQQKRIIQSVLARRKALDKLVVLL